MQSDYANLESFNLLEHGDRREQEWWVEISNAFPAYEVFWRRYIVPLTNRIDATIRLSENRDQWIRFRKDVPDNWAIVGMHHYSVFYFLARAHIKLSSPEYIFPEDVFSLLDACGDNARKFFIKILSIFERLNGPTLSLPTQKKDMCPEPNIGKSEKERGCFVEVQCYRDVILHCPVLGRAEGVGREFLPRRETLADIKHSWRAAERLTFDQLVDSRELFNRLYKEACAFLEYHWGRIVSTLDQLRETDAFIDQLALRPHLPIQPPETVLSISHSLSASGTCLQSQPAPGAVTLSSNTFTPQPNRKPNTHR